MGNTGSVGSAGQDTSNSVDRIQAGAGNGAKQQSEISGQSPSGSSAATEPRAQTNQSPNHKSASTVNSNSMAESVNCQLDLRGNLVDNMESFNSPTALRLAKKRRRASITDTNATRLGLLPRLNNPSPGLSRSKVRPQTRNSVWIRRPDSILPSMKISRVTEPEKVEPPLSEVLDRLNETQKGKKRDRDLNMLVSDDVIIGSEEQESSTGGERISKRRRLSEERLRDSRGSAADRDYNTSSVEDPVNHMSVQPAAKNSSTLEKQSETDGAPANTANLPSPSTPVPKIRDGYKRTALASSLSSSLRSKSNKSYKRSFDGGSPTEPSSTKSIKIPFSSNSRESSRAGSPLFLDNVDTESESGSRISVTPLASVKSSPRASPLTLPRSTSPFIKAGSRVANRAFRSKVNFPKPEPPLTGFVATLEDRAHDDKMNKIRLKRLLGYEEEESKEQLNNSQVVMPIVQPKIPIPKLEPADKVLEKKSTEKTAPPGYNFGGGEKAKSNSAVVNSKPVSSDASSSLLPGKEPKDSSATNTETSLVQTLTSSKSSAATLLAVSNAVSAASTGFKAPSSTAPLQKSSTEATKPSQSFVAPLVTTALTCSSNSLPTFSMTPGVSQTPASQSGSSSVNFNFGSSQAIASSAAVVSNINPAPITSTPVHPASVAKPFSFGASSDQTTKATTNSGFTFGSASSAPNAQSSTTLTNSSSSSKSSTLVSNLGAVSTSTAQPNTVNFNFGSNTGTIPTSSGFTFGSNPPTSSQANTSSFTFGTTATVSKPGGPSLGSAFSATQASGFPTNSTSSDAPKSTASTGNPPFAFGSEPVETKPSEKGPTFGIPASNSSQTGLPSIFGTPNQQASQKNASTVFGQPSTTTKASATPVVFGSCSSSSSSVFGFNGPSSVFGTQATSAANSFGGSGKTESASSGGFQFGTSNPSTGFNFGQTTNTAMSTPFGQSGSSTNKTNPAPFGSSTAAKPSFGNSSQIFSFGGSTAVNTNSTVPSAPAFGATPSNGPSFGASGSGFSGFGAQSNKAVSSTSSSNIFGNAASKPPAFGAASGNSVAASDPKFNFGGSNNQASNSGFVFGSSNSSGTGPFGATSNGPSPFAAVNQNVNNGDGKSFNFNSGAASSTPSFNFGAGSAAPPSFPQFTAGSQVAAFSMGTKSGPRRKTRK